MSSSEADEKPTKKKSKASSPSKKSPPASAAAPAKPKKEKVDPAAGTKDIRSFFGGGGGGSSQPSGSSKKAVPAATLAKKTAPAPVKRIGGKKDDDPIVIDDDDDSDVAPVKASTSKTSSSKPSPVKPKPPTATTSTFSKKRAIVSSDSEDDDVKPVVQKKPTPAKKVQGRPSFAKKPKYDDISSDSEEEDVKPAAKGKGKAKAKPKASLKSMVDDDSESSAESTSDSDEDAATKRKKAAKKIADQKKEAAHKKKRKEEDAMEVDEDGEEDARLAKAANSASTKSWFANKGAGPSAPGSKEIPDGAENCLAGLKLVFTGELSSLSREEATELAKRYGAAVTGAPSGATSYVVLGDNAGPSKLAKIKSIGIKTLDEDGFLNLIGTRKSGHLDEKTKKKQADDKKKIRAEAERMEEEEAEAERQRVKLLRKKEKEAGGSSQGGGSASSSQRPPPLASSQLWTTKYAPSNVSQICGNKTNVERLIEWLNNWAAAYQCNFKKPGKNATGTHRAILISGPPGIGKTTAAHIVAVACGYTPLELNASDARSKKLIEHGTNIDNSSLDGWFAGSKVKTNAAGVEITHRTCLIMDEVDGMSGGDRGGVGAMNALIRKTKIPIILICNDKGNPKMKPLMATTFQMPFRRPSVQEIRSRIMSICFKEKLKIPANVVDQLINGSNSDIRQVLNMLSTWKLSSSEMNFDDGKQLAKANEKNTILSPFDICNKLFSPYMFSATSRTTLSEKMDLYFQDFSFVPLFVQDNYPKQTFARAANLVGPEKTLKTLQLMDKAADSISIGDNIDRMIHSNDQQWSLLPVHGVMSSVRPAYFTYGQGGGWGGQYGMAFPQWLGQNSKQNKMSKLLNEIQIHMRLKVSANTTQIRQHYLPTLYPKLIEPLMTKDSGSDEIASVIETMDDYYLDKEDWDALVELGVGDRKDDAVLKKIPSNIKSSFTRTYNKSEHPIPFHKGVLLPTTKKLASGPKADQEDVHEEEDAGESSDEDAGGGGGAEGDVSKDSLIKKPKAAKGKGKAAAAAPKAKAKAAPKKAKK